ncbi:MAG: S-methyl-5-thioribose-1-phosphate isomerase [Bacteroidales bacterium]|nr:S-methyl-5-thioribose-1-phosphate isomerase [Bacteroidales bacterium]
MTLPSTPYYETDICHFNDEGSAVVILDQTLLPGQEQQETLRTAEEVATAIRKLKVRGAPLIGIAAAMGICVALKNAGTTETFDDICKTIRNARPTAVNLAWAVDRMREVKEKLNFANFDFALSMMRAAAHKILQAQKENDGMIGMYGSFLIEDGMGILTHCNAGHLATGGMGTATAPLYTALAAGKKFRVYADETRPLLQGARLTAYELTRSGVPTTILCDGMAASLMAQGKIDLVLVGADRIAANGDAANKVGTLGVAVWAKHFGVPFYVCAPQSTFDPNCPTGKDIPIERRDAEEVRSLWYRYPMVPEACDVYNPAFDVTPCELITGYITPRGIENRINP